MEVSDIRFDIQPDPAVWVYVPLEFPWNGFENVGRWASELSQELLKGTGVPDQVRLALQASAVAFAELAPPFAGAIERYWHLPADGGPESLAHLYVGTMQASTSTQIAEFVRDHTDGTLQAAIELEHDCFDAVVETLVVVPSEDSTFYLLRVTGVVSEIAVSLELIEQDSSGLAVLQQHLRELFSTVRISTGAAHS